MESYFRGIELASKVYKEYGILSAFYQPQLLSFVNEPQGFGF